jgi:ATP-dependent exoDNAse (exonuclease V) beta subunit
MVPAAEDDPALAAIVGVADLVYHRDGRVVVADYKTDRISGEDQLADRSEHYRPQLELYARAVQEALGLDDTPAMELWFLSADQIVTL